MLRSTLGVEGDVAFGASMWIALTMIECHGYAVEGIGQAPVWSGRMCVPLTAQNHSSNICMQLTLFPTPTFLRSFLQSIQCMRITTMSFSLRIFALCDSRSKSIPKFAIITSIWKQQQKYVYT
jgi:hypothetical protein